MLTVTLLVCAMMALVRADDNSTVLEDVTIRTKAVACPGGWLTLDGRCFFYDTTPRTWAKAQEICQNFGGSLASVHTETEHERLHTLSETKPAWIGASDCQEAGVWFWSDASPFLKRMWCDAQPDGAKAECCVQMNTAGEKCWDDISCATELPSICSKKAE